MAISEVDTLNKAGMPAQRSGIAYSALIFFPRVFSWISALALLVVDSGIPNAMRDDPDSLRRARLILSSMLVLIILGVEANVFFAWTISPDAASRILPALAFGLLLVLFVPTVFRRLGSLTLAVNLVVAAAYIVIFVVISVIGGIKSPLVHWFAMTPMLAAFMGARTSAWFWAGISFVTVLFFIAADAAGWQFMGTSGFLALDGAPLWLGRLVNFASWLGILVVLSMLFEAQREAQNSQLASKNMELQSQIEQRNRAEERSEYLAYFDELTGLPNRRLFIEQLGAAMGQASRYRNTVALLFLDLDRFKEVNDLHGHSLGDQLLQQVAQRLQTCLRESDRLSHTAADTEGNVARLGGDEFTILLNGIRFPRDAAVVAERIIEALRDAFVIDELELYIGISIGVATYSHGEMQADDLLRNADLAMYQAKNAGKNRYEFHQESMSEDIVVRSTMTDALRKSLEREELELHYQPIVDAQSRSIVGVEALVRWDQTGRGYVPTETLIAIAEETGLIIPLGNWVIQEGCRQYQHWCDSGIQLDRIAINVSAEQFRRDSVVETVRASLRSTNMDPRSLEIEITEGAMMVDEEKTLHALEELREMGVSIALDDFGTGYSSLSYVQRFPVDRVKIDRSFVSEVRKDEGARAIAMAVIALAHQLDMKVVGEGVESVLQERFLIDNSCDELQGYLYSKPLPADEITALLKQQQKNT